MPHVPLYDIIFLGDISSILMSLPQKQKVYRLMQMHGAVYPSTPPEIKAHVALGLFGPNPPPQYLEALAQHYIYWNTNTLGNPEIIVVFQRLGLGEDLTAYLMTRVIPTQSVMKLQQERVGEIVETVVTQSFVDLSISGVDVIFSNTGVTVFTRPLLPNKEKPFDGTIITTITNAKIGIGNPNPKPKVPPGKMLVPTEVVYTLTSVLVDQMQGINYIPLCIENAICVNQTWSYVGGYVLEGSKSNPIHQGAFEKARKAMTRVLKVTGLDITERVSMVPEKSDYFSKYRG